jgi:hypothetical protein
LLGEFPLTTASLLLQSNIYPSGLLASSLAIRYFDRASPQLLAHGARRLLVTRRRRKGGFTQWRAGAGVGPS